LPALPHAMIDTSMMSEIHDYVSEHKNIKRKTNNFRNKGGSFDIVSKKLSNEQIDCLKKCFVSTAENSVFYLPYQDLYLNSAITTTGTELNEVYYFIATLNDEFLGYQAAIKSGTHLNALHGAFDRTRKTTYHAYDLLFIQMTKFAIENKLMLIDFGAVLNTTKKKMVNQTIDLSYYLLSKYTVVQWLFNNLLKITKVQGKNQMKYLNNNSQ
jgi:Acetyltransferase (GNAT) domain